MIVKKPIQYAVIIDKQGDCGVFDTMSDAIESAYTACEEYSKYSISRKNDIIDAVTKKLGDHIEEFILMTCNETNTNSYNDFLSKDIAALYNFEYDKYIEKRFSVNNNINSSKDSLIVSGVIVQPVNPIETLIKNSILALKSGNSVVFSSNKKVKNVFAYAIKLLNNAIQSVNGPNNLIVTVKDPSIENTNIMIQNERVTMISTTDTQNIEKIAL